MYAPFALVIILLFVLALIRERQDTNLGNRDDGVSANSNLTTSSHDGREITSAGRF